MKVCAYNSQTGELIGCIEYDGSEFTYDPPSMQGWEYRYVEKHGADAALEHMVGATNGYWHIEEAKESAVPEIAGPDDAKVLAEQFIRANVSDGVIIGEPEVVENLILFVPGAGTSEPYDYLLGRPDVYVDTNTGAVGWFKASDWPEIEFED